MTVEIRRMWEGGPLRQFSEIKEGACKNYYENRTLQGYTGAYVCERCQTPVMGVYHHRREQKWVCAACRETVKTLISSPDQ